MEKAFVILGRNEKIRTYKLLKQTFGFEPYLENMSDKDLRKRLCSFRISTHKLRIERGRYCGENAEDRLCNSCNMIEDEIHFLMLCYKYDTLRKKMFDSINATDIVLGSVHESNFTKLMACSDRYIFKAIATFVHDCDIT